MVVNVLTRYMYKFGVARIVGGDKEVGNLGNWWHEAEGNRKYAWRGDMISGEKGLGEVNGVGVEVIRVIADTVFSESQRKRNRALVR